MQTIYYQDQIDILEPSQDIAPYSAIEVSRKKLVNYLFCFAGALFLFVFGFNAYTEGLAGLAVFTIANGVFSSLVFIYQKITGNYEKASYGVVYICITLFLYLFITGGYNNTGPLWCYVLSIMIVFVLGVKKGWAL